MGFLTWFLFLIIYCCCCLVTNSFYDSHSDPMDCRPPGCSVHRIFQARILDWVAISFSRWSSWLRDWTQVSCLAGRFFTTEPPGKPDNSLVYINATNFCIFILYAVLYRICLLILKVFGEFFRVFYIQC